MHHKTEPDVPSFPSAVRRKSISPLPLSFLLYLLFPLCLQAQQDSIPSSRLAFISDTQAPRWIEDLFLASNRNVEATRILLADIIRQKPSSLYLLGDVVNLSRSHIHWAFIDSSLDALHAASIPTHACLGNHELMGNAKEGEKNFQVRFPDHVNTGYVVILDSVATVFLNSNFSKLTVQQILKQNEWYKKELAALDSDPAILVVIVVCHHPPYSDSELVGSSKVVQDNFLPGFIQSPKSRLFITGHAHLYQHFKYEGKDLLIIGGGGGMRHPLKKKSCGLPDLSEKYKPEFHYVIINRYPGSLKVTSRRLKSDFSKVEDGLSFDIRMNP